MGWHILRVIDRNTDPIDLCDFLPIDAVPLSKGQRARNELRRWMVLRLFVLHGASVCLDNFFLNFFNTETKEIYHGKKPKQDF